MKEKFTQGNWRFSVSTSGSPYTIDGSCNIDGHNFEICVIWGVDNDRVGCEQSKANAHLIAVAPKLYRRLQYLTDMMREEYPEIAETNDKLLAEARGEK